jgi:proline iminopeptidase
MEKKPGSHCQLRNGRIYYERYQDEDSKNKIPVFYINGGPGGTCHSKRVLSELSHLVPVIIYDPLGCGYSDKIPDKLMTLEYFTDELAELIKMLGYHKANIIGHSWGGSVATNFAVKYPDLLYKLILSSPLISTSLWVKDANLLRSKLPKDVIEILDTNEKNGTTNSQDYEDATMVFYKQHVCRLEPWPEDLLNKFDDSNKHMYQTMWGATEFYVTGSLRNLDLSIYLKDISAETLFICGRYDEARPETMAYFANLMPNATVNVLESSAHMGLREEKDLYIKLVEGFLSN